MTEIELHAVTEYGNAWADGNEWLICDDSSENVLMLYQEPSKFVALLRVPAIDLTDDDIAYIGDTECRKREEWMLSDVVKVDASPNWTSIDTSCP